MLNIAALLWPKNEAPRQPDQGERGTTFNFTKERALNSSDDDALQPGRIIALHWLRLDSTEAVHG